MPVKWVFYWVPNAGSTVNSQVINEISQCIESINGVKEGRWKATLTIYRPILKVEPALGDLPRDLLGIALPEQPNKYYFILRGQKLILEAEQTIQTIMEKLQSYKTRVQFISEGFQYKLGDFMIRVGKVVPANAESLRGVIMDVEYLPLSSLDQSQLVMEDFSEILQETLSRRSMPGHFMHAPSNFADYNLADRYTSEHTAIQYAGVLTHLISTAQSIHNGRN
ncbi:mediator of RNA polymerase II transcription subunit 20a [Impatiens glandulifera]|uniref:mediator of RNA polymerase II transcription subunit 20a n=1 Tax=Impatiens glandulifera TaxID=253017 RepID=UPI001FB0544D|nr:mediator of RNA polymerase II transcription subunit 20a [Impatiens glandulifera]